MSEIPHLLPESATFRQEDFDWICSEIRIEEKNVTNAAEKLLEQSANPPVSVGCRSLWQLRNEALDRDLNKKVLALCQLRLLLQLMRQRQFIQLLDTRQPVDPH